MGIEKNLDQLSIATIRMLSMDAIEQANSGYPDTPSVTLDDIKGFRQPNSKCSGHPVYHMTWGVETTTDPLGT